MAWEGIFGAQELRLVHELQMAWGLLKPPGHPGTLIVKRLYMCITTGD